MQTIIKLFVIMPFLLYAICKIAFDNKKTVEVVCGTFYFLCEFLLIRFVFDGLQVLIVCFILSVLIIGLTTFRVRNKISIVNNKKKLIIREMIFTNARLFVLVYFVLITFEIYKNTSFV